MLISMKVISYSIKIFSFNETHVSLALSTYAGALLQPAFAALFRDLSEHELDEVLASFALEQCQPNTRLLERIRRFMKPK